MANKLLLEFDVQKYAGLLGRLSGETGGIISSKCIDAIIRSAADEVFESVTQKPTSDLVVSKREGWVSPLAEYRSPLIFSATTSQTVRVERKIVDYDGLEVEVTAVEDRAVIVRAGQEGLFNCDDYAGLVMADKKVGGILIADGVGFSHAPQLAAYEAVAAALPQMLNKGYSYNAEMLRSMIKWLTTQSPLSVDEVLNKLKEPLPGSPEYKYHGNTTILRKEIIKDVCLGATTLLGAVFDKQLLHEFRLGDGGVIVMGDDGKVAVSGNCPLSTAPPQLMLLNRQGRYVFDSNHDIEYRQTLSTAGYLVALFSDGCLRKKHKTPEAVSEVMVEFRGKFDRIDELGLAMFKECIGKPTMIVGSSSPLPVLGDDAVLVLAYSP